MMTTFNVNHTKFVMTKTPEVPCASELATYNPRRVHSVHAQDYALHRAQARYDSHSNMLGNSFFERIPNFTLGTILLL